jgi:hypothetical protein
MRDLAWIITSNAAAAGREAAEADARGDRRTASRIFEANRAAEGKLAAPGVPVVLARASYRAFISAYCQERNDSDLARDLGWLGSGTVARGAEFVRVNRRPLGGQEA